MMTYAEIVGQFHTFIPIIQHIDCVHTQLPALFDRQIAFVGCGSSFRIAKSMAAMTQMRTGRPAMAFSGGDVLLHAERYTACLEGCLLLAVSASGGEEELLMAVAHLRTLGCHFELVCLTCVKNTPLAAVSESRSELPWSPTGVLAPVYPEMSLYFAFAYFLAKRYKDVQLMADLHTVAYQGASFIRRMESRAANVATKSWNQGIVLGDAELSGLCEEGALAFKKICQVPSNNYHVLDARYGPMLLFDEETLVVVALGKGSDLEKQCVQDSLQKDAHVVVFTDNCRLDVEGVVTFSFGHPLSHVARGVLFVSLCQLLAYYKSFHNGSNPDAVGPEPLQDNSEDLLLATM